MTVSVGGALQDAGIAAPTREWLSVDDKSWLAASDEAVERGVATEALVDRLATAPTRFKSNSSWRRVVLASTDGSSTTNLNLNGPRLVMGTASSHGVALRRRPSPSTSFTARNRGAFPSRRTDLSTD